MSRPARAGQGRRVRRSRHVTIGPVTDDVAPVRPLAHPLVVAHRGSSAQYAEQTVGAYRAALADGADVLECDVRLTADWQLVAMHDRLVDRTTNGRGPVSSHSLAQLQELDAGAWKYAARSASPEATALAQDPDNTRVASLRDIIDLASRAGREVGLAIETKHPTRYVGAVEHALAEMLARHEIGGEPGTGGVWATMMSFSSLAVRRFRRIAPEVPTVLLVAAEQPVRRLLDTVPPSASTVGLDIAIVRRQPQVVAEQQERGRSVFVWTVDDPVDVALCVELGVQAVITNRPGPVRAQVHADWTD